MDEKRNVLLGGFVLLSLETITAAWLAEWHASWIATLGGGAAFSLLTIGILLTGYHALFLGEPGGDDPRRLRAALRAMAIISMMALANASLKEHRLTAAITAFAIGTMIWSATRGFQETDPPTEEARQAAPTVTQEAPSTSEGTPGTPGTSKQEDSPEEAGTEEPEETAGPPQTASPPAADARPPQKKHRTKKKARRNRS